MTSIGGSTSNLSVSTGLSPLARPFVSSFALQEEMANVQEEMANVQGDMAKMKKLAEELRVAQIYLGNLYSLKIQNLETRLENADKKISEQRSELGRLKTSLESTQGFLSVQLNRHAEFCEKIQQLSERVQLLEKQQLSKRVQLLERNSSQQYRSIKNILNKSRSPELLESLSMIPSSSTVSSRRRDPNDSKTPPDSESDVGSVDPSPRDADKLVPKTKSSLNSTSAATYPTRDSCVTVLRRPDRTVFQTRFLAIPTHPGITNILLHKNPDVSGILTSKAGVNPVDRDGSKNGLNFSVRKRS